MRLLARQRELEFANKSLIDELELRKSNEYNLISHVEQLSEAKKEKISLLRENELALRSLHEQQMSQVMSRLNSLAAQGEADIDAMQDLIEQYRLKKGTLNEHLRAIRFKQDCLVQELNDLHSLIEENYRFECLLSEPFQYHRRKTTCATSAIAEREFGDSLILLSDSAESPREDQLRRDSLVSE